MAAVCAAAVLAAPAESAVPGEVDPFIGTAFPGNTLPGANVPFGFTAPGPDSCDGPSGYCPESPILGFSQTHVSGTGGAAKYGNFRLAPYTGQPLLVPPASAKDAEQAAPGYYAVRLAGPDVRAELTASRMAALYRFTYPATDQAQLALDASSRLARAGAFEQRVVRTAVSITGPRSFAGTVTVRGGWGDGEYTLHYAAALARRPTALAIYSGQTRVNGRVARRGREQKLGVVATFDTRRDRDVRIRIGLSFVSTRKAARNLAGLPGFDFDAARARADAQWRDALGRIDVEGGSPAERRAFATALFHAHAMPHDLTGDNAWWHSSEPHYEDFFTLWDTFRTLNPLLTVIQPRRAAGMVRSLIDTQRHTGWLPDGRVAGTNGLTQVGSNGDVVVADAVVKRLSGIDRRRAYAATRKDAEKNSRQHWKQGRQLDQYKRLGYVPLSQRASASRTMEYSYDDYAVAQTALAAGDRRGARRYLERSRNWTKLWDPGTLSVRPRNADGSYLADHDPGRVFYTWTDPFYEGSALQYSTFVPHDTQSLIARTGGDSGFTGWLENVMANHYEGGNQPSLLAPYLFIHAGRHDRTAAWVRELLATDYASGIAGNDDAGSLSAWYVWGAIGLYPTAGQPYYYIGSPLFTRSRIRTGSRVFTVAAPDTSAVNKYVTGATLDGAPIDRAYITHSELARGGELRLEMGPQPNGWGAAVRPPSLPPR